MSVVIEQPGKLSAEAYHADFDSGDSNSSLRLFERSIPLYAMIRIYRTLKLPLPTPEMLFGNAFHCFLLEPEEFDRRYWVHDMDLPRSSILEALRCYMADEGIYGPFHERYCVKPPTINRRTKAGREEYAIWLSQNDGKTILAERDFQEVLSLRQWFRDTKGKIVISGEDYELLRGMRAGVMRNADARAIIELPGDVERVFHWTDPTTGLPLKMRADKIMANGIIADIKTTTDISEEAWSRTIWKLRYHRQGALYRDGLWYAAGIEASEFMHVAVSKEPPHEAAVYYLSDRATMQGRGENQATLRELKDRKDANNWAGRMDGKVTEIGLPRYAVNEAMIQAGAAIGVRAA